MFSGFFEPVLYLLSLSVGVARLVGDVEGPGGTSISYVSFVAPALLAASAMNGAFFESTYQLFQKLLDGKTYQGMLATPVTVGDMAAGEVLWAIFRGLIYSAGFLVMALALGAIESWWAVLALPGALLICGTFVAAGQVLTSTFMKTPNDMDLVGLVTQPLFLCSATFFPLSTYPGGPRRDRRGHPALPGRRDGARAHHRHTERDHDRQRRVPRRHDGRMPGVLVGALPPPPAALVEVAHVPQGRRVHVHADGLDGPSLRSACTWAGPNAHLHRRAAGARAHRRGRSMSRCRSTSRRRPPAPRRSTRRGRACRGPPRRPGDQPGVVRVGRDELHPPTLVARRQSARTRPVDEGGATCGEHPVRAGRSTAATAHGGIVPQSRLFQSVLGTHVLL